MTEEELIKIIQEQVDKDILEDVLRMGEDNVPQQVPEPDKKQEEIKMSADKIIHTQWLKRGTSTFIPTDNAKTVAELEPGVYNLRVNDAGFYVSKKDLKLDELIDLESAEMTDIFDSLDTFWKRKDKFIEYGFTYKRGILLYGPPGSGKTSIINLLINKLIKEQNGVVFILQNTRDLEIYRGYIGEIFRVIEPDRPIITIIEDIDGMCYHTSDETTLINILDGVEQIENVVYIATTNYMEKLSPRILNRPNRFDRRIKVGFPTRKAREKYIRFKLKADDLKQIDMDQWLDSTIDFTVAHLGELVKSVIILGNEFQETIDILNSMKEIPNSYDYNKGDEVAPKTIGFSRKTRQPGFTKIEESMEQYVDQVVESDEISEDSDSSVD